MPDLSPAELQYRKRMMVFWATMVLTGLAGVGSVVGMVVLFATMDYSRLRPVPMPNVEWRVEGREFALVPTNVGPRERAVLLEISDVTGEAIRGARMKYAQSWNRDRRADGVYLFYEGHGIEGPRLVVTSTAHVARRAAGDAVFDALFREEARIDAEVAGLGLDAVERPGLVTWGDEVILHLLRDKGQPAGFRIRARSGRKVFSALVIGIPFEDPGRLDAVLRPCLDALDAYPR